jgi:hypothetical protein
MVELRGRSACTGRPSRTPRRVWYPQTIDAISGDSPGRAHSGAVLFPGNARLAARVGVVALKALGKNQQHTLRGAKEPRRLARAGGAVSAVA